MADDVPGTELDEDPEKTDGTRPDLDREDRAAAAFERWLAGDSLTKIARVLGYASKSGPANAVTRMLQREEVQQAVETARQRELHRLDRLQAAVWDQAVHDQNPDLDAGKFVLAVMAHRAKLIPGLTAPTEIALTHAVTELDQATREHLSTAAEFEQAERERFGDEDTDAGA